MDDFFNSECSLVRLRIFRVTLFVGLAVILFSATYIFCSSNLEFLKGYQGLNNLFLIFKFPISIAALLAALLTIYGLMHRSEQTRKQLIINEGYKQREYFLKYLQEEVNETKKDGETLLVQIESPHRLYQKMFPSIADGIFSIDEKFIKNINELFLNILNLLQELERLQDEVTQQQLENKVCQLVHKLQKELFAERLGGCMTYPVDDNQYQLDNDIAHTKRSLAFRAEKVAEIFEFSPMFSISKEAKAIDKAREL